MNKISTCEELQAELKSLVAMSEATTVSRSSMVEGLHRLSVRLSADSTDAYLEKSLLSELGRWKSFQEKHDTSAANDSRKRAKQIASLLGSRRSEIIRKFELDWSKENADSRKPEYFR